MSLKPVKIVVLREFSVLLGILTVGLISLTIALQVQLEKRDLDEQLVNIRADLKKDEDGLLLHVLLHRVSDLNFYLDQMKLKYPKANICVDLNPPLSGIYASCDGLHPGTVEESFSLLGNRNSQFRYRVPVKSLLQIFNSILRTPVFYSAIMIALLTALFFYFRIKTLLTEPLLEMRRSIGDLTSGGRELNLSFNGKIEEWNQIHQSIFDLFKYISDLEKIENEAGQIKVARQLTHDIKSPLSMLRVASKVFTELPEEKRELMGAAVERIVEIVDSLDSKVSDSDALRIAPVAPIIGDIIKEKKLVISNSNSTTLHFEESDYSSYFAYIEPSLFKRVISNLLNNSLEATNGGGVVRVSIDRVLNEVRIKILDTGCGIPRSNLFSVLNGHSFGKAKGRGLGLSHARETVARWGGRIELDSASSVGTALNIFLKQVP